MDIGYEESCSLDNYCRIKDIQFFYKLVELQSHGIYPLTAIYGEITFKYLFY